MENLMIPSSCHTYCADKHNGEPSKSEDQDGQGLYINLSMYIVCEPPSNLSELWEVVFNA